MGISCYSTEASLCQLPARGCRRPNPVSYPQPSTCSIARRTAPWAYPFRRKRRPRTFLTRLTGWLMFCLVLVAPVSDAGSVPLERDFMIRQWRPENGLPDNRVLSLLCDRRGFLWIGTRKGVARFDGRHFVTWSRSSHHELVSQEVRALAQTIDGTLWAGTADGLVRMGEELKRDTLRDIPGPGHGSPARESIRQLLATRNGDLLVGTQFGLFRLPSGDVAKGLGPEMASPAEPLRIITVLAESASGTWWAGVPYQLWTSPSRGEPWRADLDGLGTFDTQFVHALAASPDGGMHALIGSWNHRRGRLFHRTAQGWEVVLPRELGNDSRPLFLGQDSSGALWFPLNAGALGRWQAGQLTEYALPAWLAGDAPLCFAESQDGCLWIGTERSGLLGLQPRRIRTLGTDQGLPHLQTWALLEATDDGLWVGTDGGLVRTSPDGTQTWTTASGLTSDKIRAMARDARGRVWIGTHSGLHCWDGVRLKPVEFDGEPYRGKIRALAVGRDDALWIGTAQGLYRLSDDRTQAWSPAEGLPHENVVTLLVDAGGGLWVGTDGGGLARFDGREFTRFDEAAGLSSRRVWTLHEDDAGRLWVGTDRGLNLLRDGRFAVLTTEHGLPDNEVNAIVSDRAGNLWIGHDRGIYRVPADQFVEAADGKRQHVRPVAYTEADGLLNPEVNGQISHPPAIRLRDGEVAFATVEGVALFDPDRLPDLTPGPPVQVETVLASGREIHSGRFPNGTQPTPHSVLEVAAALRGYLEFQFTAVAFPAEDAVRFEHRLLGLASEWTDTRGQRHAGFSHLPPGDYTFEVRAVNHHGYASAVPAILPFRIEPAWHERRGVWALAGLILAGGVYGAVRRRVREIRRVARLQQQAVLADERLRLARDLHDGLGANLTEVTLLTGIGETHPLPYEVLVERFRRLEAAAQAALHSLRELIWTTHPTADRLELVIERLSQSAERMLAAAGVACRLEIPSELPPTELAPGIRRQLLLATNEAVHNAIRHARPRLVELRAHVENDTLKVSISDDGGGLTGGDTHASPASGSSGGLGLSSVRDRLASLGGACDIRDRPGGGTTVTLRLHLPPRKPAHK